MRIGYSFAGEGLGHATRTAVIGPLLESGHVVVYFAPDTAARDFLAKRIGPREFERLPHFAFKKKGDRIRLLATIFAAIPLVLHLPFELTRLAARLRSLGIEAVISDFDPFLSWAARLANIPIFQINHPGVVQRVFRLHPNALMTSVATRILEGPWNERIHISFFSGDVGPILRREIFRYPAKDAGFVLLNLKPSYRPLVLPVLEALGVRYRLFPDPLGDFEEALASCSCVLSSAGHQIIAESLALNKPILVLPQRGQWEQLLNAEMVLETGKGNSTSAARLETDLVAFLGALESYRSNPIPSRFNLVDNSQAIKSRIEAFLLRCRERRYHWELLPQGIRCRSAPLPCDGYALPGRPGEASSAG